MKLTGISVADWEFLADDCSKWRHAVKKGVKIGLREEDPSAGRQKSTEKTETTELADPNPADSLHMQRLSHQSCTDKPLQMLLPEQVIYHGATIVS